MSLALRGSSPLEGTILGGCSRINISLLTSTRGGIGIRGSLRSYAERRESSSLSECTHAHSCLVET